MGIDKFYNLCYYGYNKESYTDMAEYGERLIIVGGLLQSNDALWGIANELTSGPHKIARDAVTVTLGEGLKDPEQLESLLTESDAIGISAGTKLIKAARSIISLNGLEPTSRLKLIKEMGREKMSDNDVILNPMSRTRTS